MMKSLFCLLCFAGLFSVEGYSQDYYLASAGESIFSVGTVDAGSADIRPVLRWSPVFNFQEQLHFDFGRAFGIYTGLGMRNVGLISKIDYSFETAPDVMVGRTATVKERSYSAGLPLMLKLGSMDDGVYFAAGAEAEVMFAYKRKLFEGGNKTKYSRWFNDNVTIFNPSVMAEVHFPKGQYIRFKYYLNDFLNYKGLTLIDGTYLPDYGVKSPLFYISFGAVTLKKPVKESTQSISTQTAWFDSRSK